MAACVEWESNVRESALSTKMKKSKGDESAYILRRTMCKRPFGVQAQCTLLRPIMSFQRLLGSSAATRSRSASFPGVDL